MMLAGCAKWEVTGYDPSDDAVSFGTYTAQTTRGAQTTTTTLQQSGFGVMACYTQQSAWNDAKAAAETNYMYNQQISYTDGVWIYSPRKYWPNSAGHKISFFAYAPYENQSSRHYGIELPANTAVGVPYIDLTVAQLSSSQVDLVTAEAVDMVKTTERIKFTFNHVLSRIAFAARTGRNIDANTVIKVTSLEVWYANGRVDQKARYTFTSPFGSWGDPRTQFAGVDDEDVRSGGLLVTGGVVLTDGYTAGSPVVANQQLNAADRYLMIIPQSVDFGDLYVDVGFTVTTADTALPNDESVVTNYRRVHLPAVVFEQGKAYTFVFVISPKAIEFDVVDVTAWAEAEPAQIE